MNERLITSIKYGIASTDIRIAKITKYISTNEEYLLIYNKVSALAVELDDTVDNMPKKGLEAKIHAHKTELKLVMLEKFIYIMFLNGKIHELRHKLYEKYDELTYEAMSAFEAVMAVDTSYTDDNYVEYISSTSDQRNYIKRLCNIKD